MRLKLILSICLTALTTCLQAQDFGHPLLEEFSLIQVGNQVQVDIGIVGGASCFGIDLQRSEDGLTFKTVAHISGICGGGAFTEFYTTHDPDPVHHRSVSYRLVLGAQGHTESVSFTFIPLSENWMIFPNPIRDWAVLRFENPTQSVYALDIYNLAGQHVHGLVGISSGEVFLPTDGFESGTYLFQLRSEQGILISGTFVKIGR